MNVSIDTNATLIGLEVQEYLKLDTKNAEVKNGLIECSTWFDKAIRTCFFQCTNKKDKREYIYLLHRLKNQINFAVSSLEKPRNIKSQLYECTKCGEPLYLRPDNDYWSCLQSHQHFEKLHEEFLIRDKEVKPKVLQSDKLGTPKRGIDRNIRKIDVTKTSPIIGNVGMTGNNTMQHVVNSNTKAREWYRPNILDRSNDSAKTIPSLMSLTVFPTNAFDNIGMTNKRNLKSLDEHKVQNTPPLMSLEVFPTDAFNNIGNSNQKVVKNFDEYKGKNDFRFNFECKYDPIVQQHLYPKFHQYFKFEGYFTIQRTGVYRIICLVCNCELLHQKSTNSIMSHITGSKHSRNITNPNLVAMLKSYHDVFLGMEMNMQAHQVFFTTSDFPNVLSCELCNLNVKIHDVFSHILNFPHKVYVMALRKETNLKNFIYLLEYQLQVYGIHPEVSNTAEKKETVGPTQINERKARKVDRYLEIKVHKIVKSVEKACDSSNPLDILPRRFEEHKKFLEKDGLNIKCKVCEEGKNEISDGNIQFHLIQASHMNSTGLFHPDYLYICEVCDTRFHDEIGWQMHFSKGPNKHDTIDGTLEILEYECLSCNVIIYGDEICLKRHRHCFTRKSEKAKKIVLSGDVKKNFGSRDAIRKNGELLLDGAKYVMESYNNIEKCCYDLELALRSNFPKCTAYPFGSRESGLGSKISDLDVFIDIGGMYNGTTGQDDNSQISIITVALELLHRKKRDFTKIISRPTARTPIIKLRHIPTGLECDLSFRHGLSVENTKFLKNCFLIQPVSQKLILLLKKWSLLCALNENITTYAFAMMAIFYLQTEQYLMSVRKLKELNPKSRIVIDGWETITYSTSIPELQSHVKQFEDDIVDLLKGFFKFYAEFNYKNDVVCPLMGETILKSQFIEDITGSKLPEEMSTYIAKINNNSNSEYFRALSEFCIQDPFDLSHNLTKACSAVVVEKFKKLCLLSYQMLNEFVD